MRFKEFLMSEVGTSTGDIAAFARITMPMVYRQWPEELGGEWPDKKKKKKKLKQPQVDEGNLK